MQLQAVPMGLACRWGDTSSPLYHRETSARAAFNCSHCRRRGLTQNHTQGVLRLLSLAPSWGPRNTPTAQKLLSPKLESISWQAKFLSKHTNNHSDPSQGAICTPHRKPKSKVREPVIPEGGAAAHTWSPVREDPSLVSDLNEHKLSI